jgi:hypothetical protein
MAAFLISSWVTAAILIILIALIAPVMCCFSLVFMCLFQSKLDNQGFDGAPNAWILDFFQRL